jgi:RNA polymerase sigma-70 factor (ECF subfamily)
VFGGEKNMLSFYISILSSDEEKKKFSEIYEREYMFLLNYAKTKLKGKEQEAEDVVSEGFLKLADKFQNYSTLSCSSFRKLLVVIIRNIIIDHYRYDKHNVSLTTWMEDDSFMTECFRSYEEHGELEKKAIRKEMLNEMIKKLDSLSPILKETFLLRHYIGLDERSIAKKYGVSVRTIESRLYRAVKIIKERIENDEQN